MKGAHLGELEELVLLTAAVLDGNAYSVTIVDEILKQTKRNLTLSAVHTALTRLEQKGFVNSYMGGSVAERGGRRRRLYKITASGFSKLNDAREMRSRMWKVMPEFKFDFNC